MYFSLEGLDLLLTKELSFVRVHCDKADLDLAVNLAPLGDPKISSALSGLLYVVRSDYQNVIELHFTYLSLR